MEEMAEYYSEMGDLAEWDGQQDPTEEEYAQMNRRKIMSPRVTKRKVKKPTLIKVGKHYISPGDIRCITEVKKGSLYIVKFYSEPNPQFPCWVKPEDIDKLLSYFEIIVSDED